MRSYEINVVTDNPKRPTQYNEQIQGNNEVSSQDKVDNSNAGLVKAAVIGLGKRALTDAVSRIGNYTGQRGRQQSLENISQFIGIGANIAIGFKVGGVYGALAGVAVSGYQVALDVLDNNYDIKMQEKQRQYLKDFTMIANRNNRTEGAL